MSDDNQHIDVDTEEWENTPKALRDQVKKLQKANTDLTQQISGLNDRLSSTALSDVLAGFTKPERVKSALLGDKVDPLDSEAVAKWIEENGSDFARGEGSAAPEAQQQETAGQEDRGRLDVSQIGQPGPPGDLAVINSMPADLAPAQARQWLLEHQGSTT